MPTNTEHLNLTKPTPGADPNWGTLLNTGVMDRLETLLSNLTAIAIANQNGILVLESQCRGGYGLKFTESITLTGTVKVDMPVYPRPLVIQNNTSAVLKVGILDASDANSVFIPAGFTAIVFHDGSKYVNASTTELDGTDIGTDAKLYSGVNDVLRIYNDGRLAMRSGGASTLLYNTSFAIEKETRTDGNGNPVTNENERVVTFQADNSMLLGKTGPGLGVNGIEMYPGSEGLGTHIAVIGSVADDIVRVFGQSRSSGATPFRTPQFDYNQGMIEVHKQSNPDDSFEFPIQQRMIDFYLDGNFAGSICARKEPGGRGGDPDFYSLEILDSNGRVIYEPFNTQR